MNTEQQLISKIKEGDRTAMRTLYDRYSGYVMAVALRYVPDRDDVQDVVQDSFVKIFTSIGSFSYRGEGSLKAWMGRIVANMSLDFLRKNKTLSFTSDLPNIADEPEPDDQNRFIMNQFHLLFLRAPAAFQRNRACFLRPPPRLQSPRRIRCIKR